MWVLHIFEIIVHILLTLFGYQGYCPDEIDGEGNDELSQRCSILLTWGGLAVLQITPWASFFLWLYFQNSCALAQGII